MKLYAEALNELENDRFKRDKEIASLKAILEEKSMPSPRVVMLF